MLDLRDPRLHIAALPAHLHLYQLPTSIVLPEELQLPRQEESVYSITYAPNEVSILTSVLAVSDSVKALQRDGTIKYDGPWTCLKINGPMDLTLTGRFFKAALGRNSLDVIQRWLTCVRSNGGVDSTVSQSQRCYFCHFDVEYRFHPRAR